MIITIDGPAGSGKSTAARKLAARLGIAYLDTGAMYRAIALAAIQQKVPLTDESALIELARRCEIFVDCGPTYTRVMLNGADVSEAIRTMPVSQATNFVARTTEIRKILVEKQRQIGRRLGSLVTEGRDQGSVVFPDADVKFFLDAAIEKRAERRYQEMTAEGEEASYDDILQNLRQRDGNDCHQWAPLLRPAGAIRIDTTNMTIQEVIERLQQDVAAREAAPGSSVS
jgi:CMP/dCMP kinase